MAECDRSAYRGDMSSSVTTGLNRPPRLGFCGEGKPRRPLHIAVALLPCICVIVLATQGCVSRIVGEIRFEKDAKWIVVPAEWKGTSGFVVFDTGCNTLVVDATVFSGLRRRADIVGHFIEGEVRGDVCDSPDWKIGLLRSTKGDSVCRLDLSRISHAYGHRIMALFAPELSTIVIQLDYDHGVVRFMRPDALLHTEWGTPLKLVLKNGLPCVAANIGGQAYAFAIDTGALYDDLFVPRKAFSRLIEVTGATPTKVERAGIMRPVVTSRQVSIPFFDFAGFHYRDLRVSETNNQYGSFGQRFLSRHLVTLDLPHHRVYFKRGDAFELPPNGGHAKNIARKDLQHSTGKTPAPATTPSSPAPLTKKPESDAPPATRPAS